jgi:hypothetical protein
MHERTSTRWGARTCFQRTERFGRIAGRDDELAKLPGVPPHRLLADLAALTDRKHVDGKDLVARCVFEAGWRLTSSGSGHVRTLLESACTPRSGEAISMKPIVLLVIASAALVGCNRQFWGSAPATTPNHTYVVGSENAGAQVWLCQTDVKAECTPVVVQEAE